VSVGFHQPVNCRTDSIAFTPEMASRFAGRLRLSQTAQLCPTDIDHAFA